MEAVVNVLRSALHNGHIFLDAGCGAGEYLPIASSLGAEVVGIDISSIYLRRTRAHAPGAHLVQADTQALPFRDRVFDVVLSSEVIEHVPDIDFTIYELFRVALDVVIVTTPNYGLFRRAVALINNSYLRRLNETVGHIRVFPIHQLSEKFQKVGWRIKKVRSLHVAPPLLMEVLHTPRLLAGLVNLLEQVANTSLQNLGNIAMIVCKRVRTHVNVCGG